MVALETNLEAKVLMFKKVVAVRSAGSTVAWLLVTHDGV
jgi:hypothetical protein